MGFIKKRWSIIVILLSVIISVVALAHWFWGGSILYFWDSFVPLDPYKSFDYIANIWRDGLFPGYTNAGWSWFIYWIIFFLPYPIFQSLSFSQFFLYFFLTVSSILGFYLFSNFLLSKIFINKDKYFLLKIVSFISAILYTFNPYTFFNFYFMFNPGAFLLAFFPLNILALYHLYPLNMEEGKKIFWALLFFSTLILLVPAFGVYVFFLQYMVWVFTYLVFFFLYSKSKILSKKTIEILYFFLLVILINLWWFYPAFLDLNRAYTDQSAFGTLNWFLQPFYSSQLLNSLRLLGSALMVNNKFSWTELYSNNIFTFPLFLFPFFFVLSFNLIKKRMNNMFLYMLVMTLVSLFIVKFNNPPLSGVLGFAFRNVPFFGGFRDAFQKAGIYFLPGYFVFISVGMVYVTEFVLNKKNKAYSFLLFLSLLIASIILTGPFFLFMKDNIRTEKFFYNEKQYKFSAKTSIPPEYHEIKQFLEGKCRGETILVVPRTGFVTDGVWEKYNTSFVGQDILSAITDCNFLSTAMFNSKAEAAIQVPYILLGKNNFSAFKNYLTQNNIAFVLIRKDYVPANLVNWTYVDPLKTEKQILTDNNFSKIFGNDFFSLYQVNNYNKETSGFNLTKDVAYVPTGIKSGLDYSAISELIGDIPQPVILDTQIPREKYQAESNLYAISTQCIGCIKIDPESYLKNPRITWFQKIKNYLKAIIVKPKSVSSDVEISMNILALDDFFQILLVDINNKNNKIGVDVNRYIDLWKGINSGIEKLDSDRFQKNSKYIEANNFLTLHKFAIFNLLNSPIVNNEKLFSTKESRNDLLKLFSFQKSLSQKFSEKSFQTDFNNQVYRLRLDIPKEEDYQCRVVAENENAKAKSIEIDGQTLSASAIEGKTPIHLEKGSYRVDLAYDLKQILDKKDLKIKGDVINEVRLGYLKEGKYRIRFTVPTIYKGKLITMVTKGKVSDAIVRQKDFNKFVSNRKYIDEMTKGSYGTFDYDKLLNIDSTVEGDTYLYIYFLDQEASEVVLKNFQIEGRANEEHFRYMCFFKEALRPGSTSVKTNKISPTKYMVEIPKHYKGFLIFNQTYNEDWVALGQNTNSLLPHFSSGYSNAWYLDGNQEENIFMVEYKRQRESVKAAAIFVSISVIGGVVYMLIKRKAK